MARQRKIKNRDDAEQARHLASFPLLNPNPVLEVDTSGEITFANPATRKILEHLGLAPGAVHAFLPLDIPEILRDWDRVNAAWMYREVAVQGRVFSQTVTLVPEFQVARIFGHDITERKHAQDALRDSQTRLQALVETTSDFIWEMDARGVYTYCSPQLQTLWGFDPKEMVGRTPFDLLPPKDREQSSRTFSALAASQTGFRNLEVRSFDAKGSLRVLEISGVPFYDATGALQGFRGITRDITERKQADEALRRRTEELQGIMEAVPVAVFIARDPDSRTITGNRAARELVALPAGVNISKSAPEEERPTGWQEMRNGIPIAPEDLPMQQATRGTEVRDYEMDLVFRDGTVKSVLGNATPLRDEHGDPQGGIAVLVDVTERKRAAQSLREAVRYIQRLNEDLEQRASELEVANTELERLATSLAKDLRSPLTSLRGVARLLTDEYGAQLPPPALPLVQLIDANAEEMEDMAQGLLRLMRIARQTLRKQELYPAEIVRAALAELGPECAGRRVDITVGQLPPCRADPLLLKEVWLNLLSNALKFTRRRELARIEIGSRADGNRVIYFVRDNGAGFDMSYAGTIFLAFQRYHHAEEWGGAGVGLAIVESIIRRHGGRVWAESAVDQGATFYFEV